MSAVARVKDYMSVSLVTFTPETEILDAIQTLVTHRISGAPVLDDGGNVVGILTERDCMRVVIDAGYYSHYGGRVEKFMQFPVETVESGTSIHDIAERFVAEPFRRFPVVDDNRLVGLISRRDVLRALGGLW